VTSIRPDSGEVELREHDAPVDERGADPPRAIAASRGPKLRRRDVYPHPVVDGRERREGALRAILNGIRGMFVSQATLKESQLETQLSVPSALTRTNVVAVISPKGGVGKTTVTFLVGNLLASRLKVRAIAVDANPDFGTLAAFAPDSVRNDRSLADLLTAMPRLTSAADVWPFVSRLPSGLHLLAAPANAEVMERITPALYGDLLAFLGQYYEIVLLDLGTGITDPLAQFAVQRADQVAIVTTPEWITATSVSGALRHLELTRATLVLNQARSSHAGDVRAIARHFAGYRIARRVTIPYDEQLRTMLDSGTFTLEALGRGTRLPVKQLGVEIAGQLV
jgi:MinD-like ATPase involved in chromosome partitioning or flagellar assembly